MNNRIRHRINSLSLLLILPVILLLSGCAVRDGAAETASWTAKTVSGTTENASTAEPDPIMEIFNSLFSGKRELVVGKNIDPADITEFTYTCEASSESSEYLRYRFFMDGETRYLEYEQRKGNSLPLTEDDSASSGSAQISPSQWDDICSFLEGGHVKNQEDAEESGQEIPSGSRSCLRRNHGPSEVQDFTFASDDLRISFEEYCMELCSP